MKSLSVDRKKATLRKKILSGRLNLSSDEVAEKSKRIINTLTKCDQFKRSKCIHTYISISKNNEVGTLNFIEDCFRLRKRVVVPKMKKKGELLHIEITSLNNLEKNDWGILEPATNNEIDISEIDLIVVPMAAGDINKNRLGYGKGYYDRFLSKTGAFKIGLLFEMQLLEKLLPVDSFDVPLDKLITEKRVI